MQHVADQSVPVAVVAWTQLRQHIWGETCMQAVPGFDAKGIETVRRDTCPAVAKTMERSLRLLFATRDLSEVMRTHTHTSSIWWLLYRFWMGLKGHAPHLNSTTKAPHITAMYNAATLL